MAVGGLPCGQPPTRKDHHRSDIASPRGPAAQGCRASSFLSSSALQAYAWQVKNGYLTVTSV